MPLVCYAIRASMPCTTARSLTITLVTCTRRSGTRIANQVGPADMRYLTLWSSAATRSLDVMMNIINGTLFTFVR